MTIEQLNSVEKHSFKDDLDGLKWDVEKWLLKKNPESALQLWFAEKWDIPTISIQFDDKNIISSPSVIRDTGFMHLLDIVKQEVSYHSSLSNIEDVFLSSNIVWVPIRVKYVGPDGKDIILTLQLVKDGDAIVLSPFVKDSGDGWKTLEVESDGDYTIKLSLNPQSGQREYSFEKK